MNLHRISPSHYAVELDGFCIGYCRRHGDVWIGSLENTRVDAAEITLALCAVALVRRFRNTVGSYLSDCGESMPIYAGANVGSPEATLSC